MKIPHDSSEPANRDAGSSDIQEFGRLTGLSGLTVMALSGAVEVISDVIGAEPSQVARLSGASGLGVFVLGVATNFYGKLER